MALFLKFSGLALTLYLALIAIMYLAQRRLIYVPDATRVAPSSVGLAGVREVVIEAPDGARILSWYGRARGGKPTLLYFHGNGGNLVGRAEVMKLYLSRGYGVFMMSYRGFGGSTGRPTERDNLADAGRAYDWLMRHGVSAKRLVIYGESLGSGVAVQLAAKRPAAGVILEAPFDSLVEVAAGIYRFLPVRALLRDRYQSIDYIADISAPLLILHGKRDQVVPFDLGRRLFAAAREPKTFAAIQDAGHNDLYAHGAFTHARRFLTKINRL